MDLQQHLSSKRDQGLILGVPAISLVGRESGKPYLSSVNLVEAIARYTCRFSGHRFLIAVDGLYGAGKTTLARSILRALSTKGIETLLISTDDFMKYSRQERRLTRDRFLDHPNWYDMEDICAFVEIVKKPGTEKVHLVQLYNHVNGEKDRELTLLMSSVKGIILEGMYALHQLVYPYVDLSLMLVAGDNVLMER
ncbi:hypothetical protein KC573_00950, partial [candidate division WWE3 bacterium]|nr:hypothetical protein [candidate division WWE3 bacterium]